MIPEMLAPQPPAPTPRRASPSPSTTTSTPATTTSRSRLGSPRLAPRLGVSSSYEALRDGMGLEAPVDPLFADSASDEDMQPLAPSEDGEWTEDGEEDEDEKGDPLQRPENDAW